MTNKQIAGIFKEFAGLIEIHGGNTFKVKSYLNAYAQIRRLPQDLMSLREEDLLRISGLGKSIVSRILELDQTGSIEDLERLRDQTPEGVRQMFRIRGLGAKKIKVLWKDNQIDELSQLLNACQENRLIEIKGFGQKMQETIRKGIEFFRASEGKYLMSHGHQVAERIISLFHELDIPMKKSADLLTYENVVDEFELITPLDKKAINRANITKEVALEGSRLTVLFEEKYEIDIITEVGIPGEYLIKAFCKKTEDVEVVSGGWSDDLRFSKTAELWNHPDIDKIDEQNLITIQDIKGVIHNHTTYSDGAHSVKEMADACIEKGYEYLVISDHSQSAFYANGLTEERVRRQWAEIDLLNNTFDNFIIYKSIESDILTDGSLDYSDDFLNEFDLVIASIHSQLNMDIEKATSRLIKAVEHPATRILGHMTGRLLLGRSGYPIDHMKIIDACAANNVSIELNANPYRLDVDNQWLFHAMEKDVPISINPDAHHVDGIDDIRWGVMSARSGGLSRYNCLNTMDRAEFEDWLS